MAVHIYGIRHHGPGSARSLLKTLERTRPDVLLIEGPPEAEMILSFAGDPDMQPPVAMLAYQPDEPQNAAFFPFAAFSPEWQAIQYGFRNNLAIRFIDLPYIHMMAMGREKKNEAPEDVEVDHLLQKEEEKTEAEQDKNLSRDPIAYLARIAGYEDSELWWEHTFEQRMNDEDVFSAVMEMMQSLRETIGERHDPLRNAQREAYMRKCIRWAEKTGYKNIAVVCGAWHAPALATMPPQKNDDLLLKNLPKAKIAFTWIPWTYSRLQFESGYGAGINSPGWYQHVWDHPEDNGIRWLSLVAQLFRSKGMDISTAHVIESVRLAEMLALLRNLPRPGLHELNEATETVMCFGDSILLGLIEKELIVRNKIGSIPPGAPTVPLQQDLEKLQKKLRLPAKDGEKEYVLDLREENDLERSRLLHRLIILGIRWGYTKFIYGKGTFKEQWVLRWEPELMIKVIEMGVWGNTIKEAASAWLMHEARNSQNIATLADMLEETIPADLPEAIDTLLESLENHAAVSHDISQLMQALPPLVNITRYGNVRKTETGLLQKLIDGLLTRVSIGLPNACYSLDDDAAEAMQQAIDGVNQAVALLQNEDFTREWQSSLLQINKNEGIHGMIKGYVCRLLYDGGQLPQKEAATSFSLALSPGNERMYAAAWLEGFLKGSGAVLLLDNVLWSLLNNWLEDIDSEIFEELLPLLRRTFTAYSPAEKRQLGDKACQYMGGAPQETEKQEDTIDEERAEKVLPVVRMLLGLN